MLSPARTYPRGGPFFSRPRKCEQLFFEFVAGFEHPPHGGEACGKKQKRHADADVMADVGDLEEAPAEAADQVNDRVEQCDCLPDRRQHARGIEGSTEKGQRCDDQQRYYLKPFETFRPNTDNETEQTE